MNMKGGSMLLLHERGTDGIKVYLKMKSSFFDCFYVMPLLKNGGHYITETGLFKNLSRQMCAISRTLSHL